MKLRVRDGGWDDEGTAERVTRVTESDSRVLGSDFSFCSGNRFSLPRPLIPFPRSASDDHHSFCVCVCWHGARDLPNQAPGPDLCPRSVICVAAS